MRLIPQATDRGGGGGDDGEDAGTHRLGGAITALLLRSDRDARGDTRTRRRCVRFLFIYWCFWRARPLLGSTRRARHQPRRCHRCTASPQRSTVHPPSTDHPPTIHRPVQPPATDRGPPDINRRYRHSQPPLTSRSPNQPFHHLADHAPSRLGTQSACMRVGSFRVSGRNGPPDQDHLVIETLVNPLSYLAKKTTHPAPLLALLLPLKPSGGIFAPLPLFFCVQRRVPLCGADGRHRAHEDEPGDVRAL